MLISMYAKIHFEKIKDAQESALKLRYANTLCDLVSLTSHQLREEYPETKRSVALFAAMNSMRAAVELLLPEVSEDELIRTVLTYGNQRQQMAASFIVTSYMETCAMSMANEETAQA